MRAIIPAVIYYIGVAFSVYLLVRSKNISPPRETVDYHILLHRMPLFVVILTLLIYLLVQRYSVGFAAAVSIISLVVLSLLQKETRPSVSEGLDGCKLGVEIAASIAVLFGLIGMMAQSIITPNLGVKLASFITGLTEGSLLLSLVFCMILCIVLGAGMPTAPAYVLASLTAIPAMMTLGVPKLQAHFFVFYFATISALTPPVSTASLITSRIANAGWLKTSWSAMKIAIVGWLLPFVFVMSPSILEFPHITAKGMIVTLVMILATLVLGISMYGYAPSIGHLNWFERSISFISFIFFACYVVISSSIIYIIAGIVIFSFIFGIKKIEMRRKSDSIA